MIGVIASLCIYCGSNTGSDPAHTALAQALGETCARRGIELVFGGGAIGLMGAAADGALAAGGRVVGIIPNFLEQPEIAHPGVTELVVVDSMHARKQRMFEQALPAGNVPVGCRSLYEHRGQHQVRTAVEPDPVRAPTTQEAFRLSATGT